MANIKIDLTDGDIGGELNLGDDLREVSLRNATIGVFHAEGKKLTVEFLEGARFGQLTADASTEFYNEAGQRLRHAPPALITPRYLFNFPRYLPFVHAMHGEQEGLRPRPLAQAGAEG